MGIAITLTAISALIAIGNIGVCILAHVNRRRGVDRGYSYVPLISLIFSLVACWIGDRPLGYWPLTPTMFDPGAWVLLYLPCVVWAEFIRSGRSEKSDANQPDRIEY